MYNIKMLKTQYHNFKKFSVFFISASFNAHISSDVGSFAPATGETLVFGTVTASTGSDYNPTTGIYTCPVEGIYSFSFSVQRNGNSNNNAANANNVWVSTRDLHFSNRMALVRYRISIFNKTLVFSVLRFKYMYQGYKLQGCFKGFILK